MTETTTLTPEQLGAIADDGKAAAERGLPCAPATSAAFQSAIDGLPVGTAAFRAGADAFTVAYYMTTFGLTAVADLLDRTDHDYDVENTGGFNMALVLRLLDGTVWVVTAEGLDDYTVGRYDDSAWDSADSNDPMTLDTDLSRDDVADLLDFRRAGTPFPA